MSVKRPFLIMTLAIIPLSITITRTVITSNSIFAMLIVIANIWLRWFLKSCQIEAGVVSANKGVETLPEQTSQKLLPKMALLSRVRNHN